MSLVREERLYKAYCDLCFYIGKTPFSKNKWKKRFNTPSNQNRTTEEIQNELDDIRR